MSGSPNVIEAVVSACPRAEYRRLGTPEALWWDPGLSLWVAMGVDMVRGVLEHPDLSVRPPGQPVPDSLVGSEAGEIFAAFARMSDGEAHRTRRRVVCAALESVDADQVASATRTALIALDQPPTLHDLQFRIPIVAMGVILGVSSSRWNDLVDWTSAFVHAAAPGASGVAVAAGKDAAGRLARLFEGKAEFLGGRLSPDERIANVIGFLFQTHDATAGLIGNAVLALAKNPGTSVERVLRDVVRRDPPVHNTRRYALRDLDVGGTRLRTGDAVLVVLATAEDGDASEPIAFGHGRHRCPGGHIAFAIAKEIVAYALQAGAIPVDHMGAIRMHPSGNVRMPDFRAATLSGDAT